MLVVCFPDEVANPIFSSTKHVSDSAEELLILPE